MVLALQTDVPEYIVPEWGKIITAGVDVQRDCLYYTIRAWGVNMVSQNITHGQVATWPDLAAVMNRIYQRADGRQMRVSCCYIDCGYNTPEVYEFCAIYSDWARPVKGSSNAMTQPVAAKKIEDLGTRAYGMERLMIDTETFKD